MRRLAVVAALTAVIAPLGARAEAHLGSHDITFTAGVPCSVACPWWLDVLNADVDGDGEDDVFFHECESPTPWVEGTAYDDIVTEPMPVEADLLVVEIFPLVDFDLFICELGDTWDNDGRPGERLDYDCCRLLPSGCDNQIGNNNPVPVGCKEKVQVWAKAGRQVVLRAYNDSDVATVEGRYTFRDV